MTTRPPQTWAVAVFAHNVAGTIAATLASLLDSPCQGALEVVVLANGCRDRTVPIVRELALAHRNLTLVEIDLADKANAWNTYVHDIGARAPWRGATLHVFVDGDVRVEAGTLDALARMLASEAQANAVGGLPTSGRDRQAWIGRMHAHGNLAGGLYALRPGFVEQVRQRQVRIPRGLIGEDFLVSWFVQSDLEPLASGEASARRVVFAPQGGFSFRSLQPWRPLDWKTYLRRLWRYTVRGVQLEMVRGWLWHQPAESLPPDVDTLYRQAPLPSRLKRVGAGTGLRLIVVQRIRALRIK